MEIIHTWELRYEDNEYCFTLVKSSANSSGIGPCVEGISIVPGEGTQCFIIVLKLYGNNVTLRWC